MGLLHYRMRFVALWDLSLMGFVAVSIYYMPQKSYILGTTIKNLIYLSQTYYTLHGYHIINLILYIVYICYKCLLCANTYLSNILLKQYGLDFDLYFFICIEFRRYCSDVASKSVAQLWRLN